MPILFPVLGITIDYLLNRGERERIERGRFLENALLGRDEVASKKLAKIIAEDEKRNEKERRVSPADLENILREAQKTGDTSKFLSCLNIVRKQAHSSSIFKRNINIALVVAYVVLLTISLLTKDSRAKLNSLNNRKPAGLYDGK